MNNLTPDIYVVDGNITIFCGSHSDTFKSDVLHSSLYSLLVSNTETHVPESWFNGYKMLLEKIYWETETFKNSQTKSSAPSIFSIIEPALASTLQQSELQQIATAFSVIKQLPDDSAITKAIINKIQARCLPHLDAGKVDPTEKTPLTVSALLTIIRNDKTLVTLKATFPTTKIIDIEILDQSIPGEAMPDNIDTRLWCSHLAEEEYATARHEIIKKLGSTVDTHLFHVGAPVLSD